ncbi:MAG: AAA family ATPase, partial [Methanocalculus sp.]|uniref:AAA family ATPase n=1 Tax=Methanocalculus sp. TaxID=2004547 RepID=UPI002715C83C
MKIRSLYIDGFGRFHDWRPAVPFGERLTVITGPNEAGKTTLLAFIRRMLFGFPDGRRNINHYRPLNGGSHGGRLDIEGVDGTNYSLTRNGVRGTPLLTLADGSPVSTATLRSLTGPLDSAFYETVCAIGLSDLSDFTNLNRSEIRDRLALAGSGNLPVRDVQSLLSASAEEIFIPRGKQKKVNLLVHDLRSIRGKIRSAEAMQQEYDRITREAVLLEDERIAFQKKQALISEEIAWMKALAQAWDVYSAEQIALRKLQVIPILPKYPEDLLETLTRMEVGVEKSGELCDGLRRDIENFETERSGIEPRWDLLSVSDQIHDLERGVERYRTDLRDLDDLILRISHHTTLLHETRLILGEGWSQEKISGFDLSVAARDEAARIRSRVAETSHLLTDAKSSLRHASHDFEERQEHLTALLNRRDQLGVVQTPATVRSWLSKARELKGAVQDLYELDQRINSLSLEEARTDEIIRSLAPKAFPTWPGFLVLISASIALGSGLVTGRLDIAGILALILFISAAGIFVTIRGQKRHTETDPKKDEYTVDHQRIGDQKRVALEEKSRLNKMIAALS